MAKQKKKKALIEIADYLAKYRVFPKEYLSLLKRLEDMGVVCHVKKYAGSTYVEAQLTEDYIDFRLLYLRINADSRLQRAINLMTLNKAGRQKWIELQRAIEEVEKISLIHTPPEDREIKSVVELAHP